MHALPSHLLTAYQTYQSVFSKTEDIDYANHLSHHTESKQFALPMGLFVHRFHRSDRTATNNVADSSPVLARNVIIAAATMASHHHIC